MVTVYTNYHWRDWLSFYELTERQQEQARLDYDYLDNDQLLYQDFIVYRGCLYAIGQDFMRVDTHAPDWLKQWHGYLNDTFFSGVVIRFNDDNDQIQIGTFY